MQSRYEKDFLTAASMLDALLSRDDRITKHALNVVDKNDDESIRLLLNSISEIPYDENDKDIKKAAKLLKDSCVLYCGYIRVKQACSEAITTTDDNRTLDELVCDLDRLVGLSKVKAQVNDLIAYQKVQKLRRDRGFYSKKNTLHMAFTGNPGTGKTTVARIVGHIFKRLGLLTSGHFIEVSRTDLIAGYQGQTALKVKKVIEKAKGGVLFIDEAYSLTENDHTDSYGRECLTELTKALEDYRDDLVVIVAGYTEPMVQFFQSNPGLKSRFNTFIEFDDYSADELTDILDSMCRTNAYKMDQELREEIKSFFEQEVSKNEKDFANGRLARNIYDDLIMCHARRVVNIANPSDEDLITLEALDFVVK